MRFCSPEEGDLGVKTLTTEVPAHSDDPKTIQCTGKQAQFTTCLQANQDGWHSPPAMRPAPQLPVMPPQNTPPLPSVPTNVRLAQLGSGQVLVSQQTSGILSFNAAFNSLKAEGGSPSPGTVQQAEYRGKSHPIRHQGGTPRLHRRRARQRWRGGVRPAAEFGGPQSQLRQDHRAHFN